jgi:hypothetical protein
MKGGFYLIRFYTRVKNHIFGQTKKLCILGISIY